MNHYSLLDKAFFLKKSRFFSSLDLDLLLILAEKADLHFCAAGDIIFPALTETHRMYLIMEGEMNLTYREKEVILTRGEVFGDEALFNQKMHSYKVECSRDGVILVLMRSHILSLIEQSPSFACSLLEYYATHFDCRHLR